MARCYLWPFGSELCRLAVSAAVRSATGRKVPGSLSAVTDRSFLLSETPLLGCSHRHDPVRNSGPDSSRQKSHPFSDAPHSRYTAVYHQFSALCRRFRFPASGNQSIFTGKKALIRMVSARKPRVSCKYLSLPVLCFQAKAKTHSGRFFH